MGLVSILSIFVLAWAPVPERAVPAGVASGFRTDAFQLYAMVDPGCPATLDPNQLARYRPARERTAALERRTAGMAFGQILQQVHEQQIQMRATIDCAAGDGPGTAERIASELERLDPLLTRMEHIVSHYSAKG